MTYEQQLRWQNNTQSVSIWAKKTHARVERTIARTFGRVGLTMLVAAAVAYLTASGLLSIPYSSSGAMIAWIASLAMIFGMNKIAQKVSYPVLGWFLMLFGALQGFGLTGILYAYSIDAIYQAFMWAWVMFAVLSVVWYYTKIDITKRGPILFWSMIAWFITMLLNMFLIGNGSLNVRMSLIGIVIFAGYIVYDMNILTQKAESMDKKIEILIALWLFISFMNIFQMLLSLMWRD